MKADQCVLRDQKRDLMFLEGYKDLSSKKDGIMRPCCTESPNKAIRLKNFMPKTHSHSQSALSGS